MEGTLGHLREHLGHRVGPVLGLHLGVSQDVKAVVPELVAEEEVGEVDLSEDVGEVEELAQEEPDGIEAMGTSVEAPVTDDVVNLALLTLSADDGFLLEEIQLSLKPLYFKDHL